jgi:hypothetical protein
MIPSWASLDAHLGDDLLRAGRLGQLARLPHVVGERLLAVDVLSEVDREHRRGGVGVVRRADVDAVDLAAHLGEELPVVAVELRVGELLRRRVEALLVDVAERDDLHGGMLGDVAQVRAAHAAAADGRVAELLVLGEGEAAGGAGGEGGRGEEAAAGDARIHGASVECR